MKTQYSYTVGRCQRPALCSVTSHFTHVKSPETQRQSALSVQKVSSLTETKNALILSPLTWKIW